MLLKKIKLENIRSYVNEEIEFPEGSMLLAGNIGCGKSTILQAIDFALFGITQELSGGSLLRNGEHRGAVELQFAVDNKNISIRRTLRRGTSVVQDSGHISIESAKRDATATELKQYILTLLNYPQELLTKSKSLIYRYTVYTPQEEMKSILLGDKDHRLDTLRKVFGMDRYKRVKENAELVISYIKAKNRENAIIIADLEQKKTEQEKMKFERKQKKTALDILLPKLNEYHLLLEEKKKNLQLLEKESKDYEEKKKNLDIADISLKHKHDQAKKNLLHIQELESSIKGSEEELQKEIQPAINREEIARVEQKMLIEEGAVREFLNRVQAAKTNKHYAEKIIADMVKLDVCPVCKQKVSQEHLNTVTKEAREKIIKYDAETQQLLAQIQIQEQTIKATKATLESMRKAEHAKIIYDLKKKSLEEKKKEKEAMRSHNQEIQKDIDQLQSLKEQLQEQTKIAIAPEAYNKVREEMEALQEHKQKIEIEKATKEHDLELMDKQIETLSRDIAKKEEVRNNISYLKELHYWLENMFINLMTTLEKKIMLKVHADFSSFFRKWFEILVDTEAIKVSLDDEFSPIIEQNGHEISYNYLSGGEKTAAALAYRLALNQVINSIMSVIRTKDLLILDEPTDGFSAEQIDRLRTVLEELNMRQVIIVSHESKMESFVEHVIKIEKKEHVSSVVLQ